ncbi:hypothetical protein SLA2020_094790 [Shorea laevis]
MSRQVLPLFDNLHQRVLRCLTSAKSSLSHVCQAHTHILKAGIIYDTLLSSRLLALYSNHQCFAEAQLVLHSIPEPSVLSFANLIYALTRSNLLALSLDVFSQMLSHGIWPESRILPNIINACGGLSSLETGKQVHGIVFRSGLDSDSFVQGSLVNMYVKCDEIRDARKVFDRLPQRHVVSCSALISAYARKGCVDETMRLFNEMKNFGVKPNLITWNGVLSGFNHSGHCREAVVMFQKMHSEGFQPDDTTLSSILSAVGDLEELNIGIQAHCCVIKQGLGQERYIRSALVDMYGKCACALELTQAFDELDEKDIGACNALIAGLSQNGAIYHALKAFEQFRAEGMELNVVSWTSIIAGCTQNGKDIQALELFRAMQSAGLKPNSVTIPCLLPACGNIAALMHGKAAHCFVLRTGIADDHHVGSALIDMYAKCGRIHMSRLCFDKMPTKNLVCWNAILGGYAMHGKTKEAKEIFDLMQRAGHKPNLISFCCILSACSHGGLVEEGWSYFNSMTKEHGIEAKTEHYASMVNLLGHAAKLEEAYALIKQMPFEPNACVWGALLGSCRLHNNVGLGEIAAKKLFELEPENPGNYVLLSNIYASKAMWTEVDAVRDIMINRGLKKNPGCSWIEIKNKVHMLLAGDKSHPEMRQILEKLNELSMEMKKVGYYPETDFVLQNVEEQDKEQMLGEHSEKLAVAYDLLNTSPGSPLQVIKNLRICRDCHAFMKFISSLEEREIFVRDANRFHHFKDGACSCGDFW